MTLRGWSSPLPPYIEAAVLSGQLTVTYIKGFDYLQGSVQTPYGYVVVFR